MKPWVCATVSAVITLCLLAVDYPAQIPSDELERLLTLASDYVDRYEEHQLGNVVAAEKYIQDYGPQLQRRLESDFLIVLIGGTRMGVRKVNKVDGVPVKSSESSFEAMMDDSPAGVAKRIAALKDESTRYDIGPVLREINLPTFALKVLRRKEVPRFAFTPQRGLDKINGLEGIEVRFRELRSPTLVHGGKGESLLSTGTVWIEPATGRILKTDFNIENPYTNIKGQITVTYAANKALGILVPEEMKESYSVANSPFLPFVRCTATYSNFRSFNVDVKSSIETPAIR
jgi:hypothetical protein